MASSGNHLDTPITLKVNFEGVTRRYKLPLRDLNVNVLENKLRGFLQIPFGTAVTFERYSDSAASYVVLDPHNIPVYKQLYRAAKAKQKLKLRVTKPAPAEESNGPKPVTVEDEPEPEPEVKGVAQPAPRALSPTPTPVKTPADAEVIDTIIAPQAPEDFPDFVEQWLALGMPRIYLRRNDEGVEVIDFLTSTSPSDPKVTLAPLLPSPASSLDSSLPPLSQYRFSKNAAKMPSETLYSECLKRDIAAAQKKTSESSSVPAASAVLQSPVSSPVPVPEKKDEASSATAFPGFRRQFTVCCNSCDEPVPDAHFHCSTCDDGDFDLCQDCISQGITCYDESHWLIKRTIKDGQISNSTTHIAPKKSPAPAPALNLPIRPAARFSEQLNPAPGWGAPFSGRTCNCCVQEFPEQEFVHCTTCDDYDLCKLCFIKDQHGHHPKHGFTAAVPGTVFEQSISSRLSPGRNAVHNAICDGCNKYIRGVRHKCLDCPDWDYCATCQENASFVHPNHRFVAIYEPLSNISMRSLRATHVGICCDGPLCLSAQGGSRYITGIRYKCAICDDVDFCANCEASPANTHNKTHPLIKFKTPVRSVSVTTTGEHEDGQRLPPMGDRAVRHRSSKRSAESSPASRDSIAATPVQTVVDVEPIEQEPAPLVKEEVEVKQEVVPEVAPVTEKQSSPTELVAIFKHDTVADGTILPPNHTFEQTWVLRNEGSVAWPAGCSVKFVGGDYMCAIDPAHPAGIHELVSASESTKCYNTLNPGQEFPFTVLMRTPEREGKVISYWRLTTRDGVKFGHKLWCDVTVKAPLPKAKAAHQPEEVNTATPEIPTEVVKSQMIIPKLEHESPSSSFHEDVQAEAEDKTETATLAPSVQDQSDDDFEDCAESDGWAEESEEGFMTDEEYDILDASDEDYLSEQQKIVSKK